MKPTATTTELLLTCPACRQTGFTAAGLSRHRCRAKPGRARLTLAELHQAGQAARPGGAR
jgi:hypothetical protein